MRLRLGKFERKSFKFSKDIKDYHVGMYREAIKIKKRKIRTAQKDIYQAINKLHLPSDLATLRDEFLRILSPSPAFFKRARKWYTRVVAYENKMTGAGSHTISELLSVYGHLIDLHEKFKDDTKLYKKKATEYLRKKGLLKD